jgi:hypothetical protein
MNARQSRATARLVVAYNILSARTAGCAKKLSANHSQVADAQQNRTSRGKSQRPEFSPAKRLALARRFVLGRSSRAQPDTLSHGERVGVRGVRTIRKSRAEMLSLSAQLPFSSRLPKEEIRSSFVIGPPSVTGCVTVEARGGRSLRPPCFGAPAASRAMSGSCS